VVEGGNHKKMEHTVRTANFFGKVLDAKQLTIVDEIDPKSTLNTADDDSQLESAVKKRRALKKQEDQRIEKLEKKLVDEGALSLNHKCIIGKPGYTIGHYAAANHADLLVMRSPDKELGLLDRVFAHDLEYVLSDLPCCLMIVNQPTEDVA
jgi:nucleotide-binding universal stress UspA family protein